MDPKFLPGVYRSARTAALLRAAAERAQANFQSIAPVETGEWRDSTEVSVGENERGFVVGRLSSNHPAALSIEFGTSDTPKHATLRRSLDNL